MVGNEGKDWDKLLPYLLFAYREVPQVSTGFLPFELFYGHEVQGTLNILSESWQADQHSKEIVVTHVFFCSVYCQQENETCNLPN